MNKTSSKSRSQKPQHPRERIPESQRLQQEQRRKYVVRKPESQRSQQPLVNNGKHSTARNVTFGSSSNYNNNSQQQQQRHYQYQRNNDRNNLLQAQGQQQLITLSLDATGRIGKKKRQRQLYDDDIKPPQQQQQQQQQAVININDDRQAHKGDVDNIDNTNNNITITNGIVYCSFCKTVPAAIVISPKNNQELDENQNDNVATTTSLDKSKNTSYLCLLHYYTTHAVLQLHHSIKITTIHCKEQYEQQLPILQNLFADAFVQLQDEISECSARTITLPPNHISSKNNTTKTTTKTHDLLSVVTQWSNSTINNNNNTKNLRKINSALKSPPKPNIDNKSDDDDKTQGGFIRTIQLPQRLIHVQQQQQYQHKLLEERMKYSMLHPEQSEQDVEQQENNDNKLQQLQVQQHVDVTRRRHPTKQSVWNIVTDTDRTNTIIKKKKKLTELNNTTDSTSTSIGGAEFDININTIWLDDKHCTTCSIITTNSVSKVELLPSSRSINSDRTSSHKAETWGNKDRNEEIINKYRCSHCGKVWTEID